VIEATAPPLSEVLPDYTDSGLARLVRFGVKRDGRTAVGMISGTFYPLGDLDLARIVAYLRSQHRTRPAATTPRQRRVFLLGRIALALGWWKTSADEVDTSIPRWGELPQRTPFERGRYLASITCSECHGLDFRGEEYEGAPSLIAVRAYSREQFRYLLRTGVAFDGRSDLGLMGSVARQAFFEFTDAEADAIHEFLASGIDGEPAEAAAR
jgi:cytochrome c553